jgi:hypothetical protein
MIWTDELLAILKRLNGLGRTGSEIANEMGTTRSAIRGKIWRLFGRTTTTHKPKSTKYHIEPKVKKAKIVPIRPLPKPLIPLHKIRSKRVGFMQWRPAFECAYIIDDSEPGGVRCGNRTHPKESWCYDHCRIVYQPEFYP